MRTWAISSQPDSGTWIRKTHFTAALPKKFGVRKSLFYYQPDQMPPGYYRKDFDWTSWTSWNKADSERVDRSYDYPHVVAADWVLYRLARNYEGLVTNHPWDWYLTSAYETSVAMVKLAPGYAVFGQMDVERL